MRMILVAVAAVAMMAGPARATTVVRFAFDSLCVRAQTIAYVRCMDIESFLDEERGQILTRSRFQVMESMKGTPGREIVLTLPGGTVDGHTAYVPGIPRFSPGEETVLFLTGPDRYGLPWPMGLGQGCYPVRTAEEGETRIQLQAGVTPLPDGALFKPVSSHPFDVSLQAFLSRIRQTLATSPADR